LLTIWDLTYYVEKFVITNVSLNATGWKLKVMRYNA
jgi:hypothetical protein